MKLSRIIIAVLFAINCAICIWFLCLPKESEIHKILLSSPVSNSGAKDIQITAGKAYQAMFYKYVTTTRASIAILAIDSIFLIFAAVYLETSNFQKEYIKQSAPITIDHPLSSSVPDSRPPIQFDPQKPYRLEFGRGSVWHGLNTVALNETGTVKLHLLEIEHKNNEVYHYSDTATLTIDSETSRRIAQTILDLRIIEMDRAYHANIDDGTQWIFWLVQGKQEKSVYFDNHYPKAIQDFAEALDKELKNAGSDKLVWSRIPDNIARDHEKAIHNSIKDKPDMPDSSNRK